MSETAGAAGAAGAAVPGEIPDLSVLDDDTILAWSSAEPFDYRNADLSAYIRLGQVEGLNVTSESAVLTDEEFDNEIDSLLDAYSEYAEIRDRTVEEGDTVRADYAGYLDGVAFQGGTAYDQEITAQGGTGYINGFAEAFIGQYPGEEFSFTVTFPEDYGVDELNGREVTFISTVHAILSDELIVPELNDEFVSATFGYDSVDEFLDAYRLSVENQKEEYVRNAVMNDLWAQVVGGAEVLAYPESEVKRTYAAQRTSYAQYASYYQVDYAEFLSDYLNMTDEELYAEAESYVKEDLILYSLAEKLNVNPTDEEYDAGIEELARYNGMTADDMRDYYGEDTLRVSVLWEMVMDRVRETANITEG